MGNEVKAILSLDSSKFTAGINAALSSLSGMASSVGGIAARASGALAAIGAPLSVGAFAYGIKSALDFGGTVSDMSARTGIAVKDLVILGQAFQNAGMAADGVGPAINRMQKALTGVNEQGEPTNKTFEKLGIDLEKLRGLDPGAQFETVSKAISGLSSPAEQAAAAIGIFGKSGGEMLALFKDAGAIETATNQVGAQAALLQKNATVMDSVSDAFNAVKSTLRGFFVGVIDPLLPLLKQVADWLNGLGDKAVEVGRSLGAQLAAAFNILRNGFQQGKLGELAGLALKIGFGEAVNYIAGGLRSALLGLASIITNLFSQDYGSYLLGAWSGAIKMAVVFFGESLSDVINGISAALLLGFEKSVAVFYKLGAFFKDLMAYVEAALVTAFQTVASKIPGLGVQKQSFEQNLADAKAAQTPAASYKPLVSTFDEAFKAVSESGGLKDMLAKIRASAATDFDVAGAAAKSLFEKIKADMIALGKDFKPGEVFDTKEWRDKLAELAASLNVPMEAVDAATKKLGGANAKLATPESGAAMRGIEADSLAKIGLFTGGTIGNVLIDAAKATSDNTRQMVQLLAGGIQVKDLMARAA